MPNKDNITIMVFTMTDERQRTRTTRRRELLLINTTRGNNLIINPSSTNKILGLLVRESNDYNILSDLVISSNGSYDEDHHLLADTTFLASLVRLRQSDLFKIEDIQRYNLLHDLCGQTSYFAEQRFRYLTDMNPTALISIDNNDDGYLPLHHAAADFGSIEGFRQVFDTGMRYLLHRLNWRVGKVTREETKLWMP